jgi:nucleoside 2-deoxyribosyltransferase
MNTQPRIYLAGPDIFYPDVQERYARLKRLCAEVGLLGVAPPDGMEFAIELTPECAAKIRQHDISLLKNCDAVLANVSPYLGLEPDSGTAYEMGYAAALGLPVIGYALDGMLTHERAALAGRPIGPDGREPQEGLLLENFGLTANLMLAGAHDCVCLPGASVEGVLRAALLRLERALHCER